MPACVAGGGRPPATDAERGDPEPAATAGVAVDSAAESGAPDSLPVAWSPADSVEVRAPDPAGGTTSAVGDSAAPARDASVGVSDSARATPPGDSAAAFTARRIPLLPWPFYGRRSLARLGPGGVAELPASSPEHRLLDLLDFAECAGRPRRSVETCYFLEGGRVYAVRREPGTASRFRLTPLDVPRGGSPRAGAAHVDTSAPDGPVLVVPPGVEITLLESAP